MAKPIPLTEPYHVDLVDVGILARIEAVESTGFWEEGVDGDFGVSLRIVGTVELCPGGVSLSDAVGLVLADMIEKHGRDDGGTTITIEAAEPEPEPDVAGPDDPTDDDDGQEA